MNKESLKTYRFCHASRKQVFYFNLKTSPPKKISLCQMNRESLKTYRFSHASRKQTRFLFQFENLSA